MSAAKNVQYRVGNDVDLDVFIELYHASTLGERRPVDDRDTMADMLGHADLMITAWDGDRLVGLARTLTDFSYVAYLADLAVARSHQRGGIGTQLVHRTRAELGPRAMLVLLSAPAAVDYYPKIGFERHPQAFVALPGKTLSGGRGGA